MYYYVHILHHLLKSLIHVCIWFPVFVSYSCIREGCSCALLSLDTGFVAFLWACCFGMTWMVWAHCFGVPWMVIRL